MDSILTVDIGSTSMRAVLYDIHGNVLHKCRKGTIPDYLENKHVELDANKFVTSLLSLLKESNNFSQENNHKLLAISVTSQRSSVVPVDSNGTPLALFIMWHDKRTIPLCQKLHPQEDLVFSLTGLRISPVLSAVKMTWIRQEMPDIYKKTAKMLGIQDLAIHTLCGEFITDQSLASNTNLLNIHTRKWDQDLLDIFSVKQSHLCDLVPPGSVCSHTTPKLQNATGIPQNTPVVTAGGDQQSAALGLGIISEGKLKCTTGTGSYLIAHSNTPVIDKKKRFLCKVGAMPGSYNLEAGMLTTGTVYRWFLEQFYSIKGDRAGVEEINKEVLSSPPGANGVLLLPHFEGSGAPHWNPDDCGVFYRMNLATTRADMARAVLEGIVMEMGENILLFKNNLGHIPQIHVSGGMTKFSTYNQLQADIYGCDVVLHSNCESTSLGAWISAVVACGLYKSYEDAFSTIHPPGTETVFTPDTGKTGFYEHLNCEKSKLYNAIQHMNNIG